MSALYGEYDPAVLKRLQKVLLEMLGDFDTLCKRHGLHYFAGGGTAIGAVRHQGMIPWDDDIDLNMLREDYEKFLAVAETEYGSKYFVVNAEKYPSCPFMSTRWCLSGTTFREECFRHLDLPLGIFVDIYCFDAIPDDDRAARKQWRKAWFWGKLALLRQIPSPVLFMYGIKARVAALVCRLGSIVLKVFFRQSFLVRKAKEWARKSEKGPKCRRAAWMFDTVPYLSVVDAEKSIRTRTVPFNGRTIELAEDCEDYLRRRFGDYMAVPPPDRRHNHPPWKLDFGPWGGA